VTERQEPAFLMTPSQHRQWAKNARKLDRPDLTQQHEQLAQAIEKIGREQEQETGRCVGSGGTDAGSARG
jgi:hypothetical protein